MTSQGIFGRSRNWYNVDIPYCFAYDVPGVIAGADGLYALYVLVFFGIDPATWPAAVAIVGQIVAASAALAGWGLWCDFLGASNGLRASFRVRGGGFPISLGCWY
jgi:hypothetical protein